MKTGDIFVYITVNLVRWQRSFDVDGCLEMGVYISGRRIVRRHYFSVCYLENTETFLRFVSPFTILPTAEVSLV